MNSNEIQALLDKIDTLHDMISSLSSSVVDEMPSESPQIDQLATALAKAQGEIRLAAKASQNPYFKSMYADSAAIVIASRIPLTKNGLSVVQKILFNNAGQALITTKLMHNSGQWIESRARLSPKDHTIQAFGSAITYLRRYLYASLIGVFVQDEDDDAEAAMESAGERIVQKGSNNNQVKRNDPGQNDVITREQLVQLEEELQGVPEVAEEILSKLKIRTLADMDKKDFGIVLKHIVKVKHQLSQVK